MKKILVYGSREEFLNYAEALEGCGAVPVFSKSGAAPEECGGLLLPGGGDVDPALYGQPCCGSANIDPQRDRQEMELIRSFSEMGRPILGICRGLQILNTAFGGELIQDIDTAAAHKWEKDTGDKLHVVHAEPGSFLFPLYGETFTVNSAHHQAAGKIAPGWKLAAQAEDGVVEALEWPEKKIYAVQWHPERVSFRHARPEAADGRAVFEFFLGLLPASK